MLNEIYAQLSAFNFDFKRTLILDRYLKEYLMLSARKD